MLATKAHADSRVTASLRHFVYELDAGAHESNIPKPDTNSRISVLSFSGLRSHPLAETHAYTTTVFVSELDAGGPLPESNNEANKLASQSTTAHLSGVRI